MNESPKVSIIIAAFNSVERVKYCLATIRQNDFDDLETIVVEDATPEKIRNAIKTAKGRWIHFLSAEDRLCTGFRFLGYLLRHDNMIYTADTVPRFEGPLFLPPKRKAILYPASIFRKYRFNPPPRSVVDRRLNFRLKFDFSYKTLHCPVHANRVYFPRPEYEVFA
jgi:glycosyltransferase involved in cell wall biosynthesis